MTPRDRFHTALDLGTPDRLPIFYQHLGAAKWLLQDTGLRIHDGLHDPEVFARLSLAALRMYGFDNVMAGWGDLLVEAKAHGMEWKFPERDFYPRPDKYVPMSEVDKIQPVDPMDDPSWSIMLKAAKIMVDEAGSDAAVVSGIAAPNLIASEIVGMDNLMMGYLTDPDVVEKLLSTIVQSSIAYCERAVEAGVENIFIENSLAGGRWWTVRCTSNGTAGSRNRPWTPITGRGCAPSSTIALKSRYGNRRSRCDPRRSTSGQRGERQ